MHRGVLLSLLAAVVTLALCLAYNLSTQQPSSLTNFYGTPSLVNDPTKVMVELHRSRYQNKGPTVLVAQTTGWGPYKELMDTSSPPNRRYAEEHGFDYMGVYGIVRGTESKQSTFNKAYILEFAIQQGEWDYLFYLDADALVVDKNFDPRRVISQGSMLAACMGKTPRHYDINIGVFIWDLRHRDSPSIAHQWASDSTDSLNRSGLWNSNDDQVLIRRLLQRMPEERGKALVDLKVGEDRTLFNYWEGKHVKHLIRESSSDWTGDSVALRAEAMRGFIEEFGL